MTTQAKPTVVLIHGAFAESASWNGVIGELLAQGYPVIAESCPLRGVEYDAAHAGSVLDGVEGPVVLVGHSYGGMVITSAAAGRDGVRALVYVAGFAPEPGESAADLAGRFPGGTLGDTLVAFPLPGGGTDVYIDQRKFHGQFAADVPAEQAALMAATQRPITEQGLGDPLPGDAAWATIPSWFVFGDQDANIPAASHRFMAERAGSRQTEEIAGGSHAIGVSQPGAVTDMIRQAAGSI